MRVTGSSRSVGGRWSALGAACLATMATLPMAVPGPGGSAAPTRRAEASRQGTVLAATVGPTTAPLAGRRAPSLTEEERVDTYLSRAAALGFSGAVLVARDGQVTLHAGYGLADREAELRVTPETVFDIGSITKQFTAAAILALEEEGKLRVSDPITRFFDDVPADKRGITLHHLLTHSSGLQGGFGGDYERMPRDSIVRVALDSELLWEPGTRYRYSNAGYSLLGAIVERLSGRSYEDYLREALFEPAGLVRTGYLAPDWSEERIAVGYRGAERWGTPLDHAWAEDGPWWNLRANGGLLSSAGDLYRWHRALGTDAVLAAASREKLFTPHVAENEAGTSHYGYGWAITPTRRDTRLVWHNGGNGVFFADLRRYVEEDVVIIFLTNAAAFEPVERGVLGLAFGEEVSFPPAAAADVPAATLAGYVGTYRLPSGGALRVAVQEGRLVVDAEDPTAGALLVPRPPPGPEAAHLLEGIEERTRRVVDALAAGDPGPFREIYLEEGGPDVEGEVEWWTRAFRLWRERYGDYVGSSVLASAAGSGPRGETVDTYVLARFENRARVIAFRQAADGEPAGFYLDALPSSAIPERFRFVPLSETEFATFHFGTGLEGRIRFDAGPGGEVRALRVAGPEGEVVARPEG